MPRFAATRVRSLRCIAVLGTRLVSVDIEGAKDAIEEAERAEVVDVLIDQVVEHTEKAVQAQLTYLTHQF